MTSRQLRNSGIVAGVVAVACAVAALAPKTSAAPWDSVMSALTSAGGEEKLWTEVPKAAPVGQVVPQSVFADLAEKLSPAVVHVAVRKRMAGAMVPFPGGSAPFGFYFGMPPQQYDRYGLGTGFIINKSGHVLTNNHVIEGATEIRVILNDKREFDAEVVGAYALADMALLKFKAPADVAVAPLGDSDSLRIGEWVMAIGNPFGLDHTVTAGIVSAKGRKDIQPSDQMMYSNFIQTDASINPGNSGGPLINLKGEVVGINSAVNAAGQGIGFAIPVNMAKQLLPQLARGKVERSYLGVLLGEVPGDAARAMGLQRPKGALIAQVAPSSPADKAGLKEGDVVLAFNGTEIEVPTDLTWLASTSGAGSVATLSVLRQGKEREIKVTLGEYPEPEKIRIR
jgi:serine protease Do